MVNDGAAIKQYEDRQERFFAVNPMGRFMASLGDSLIVASEARARVVQSNFAASFSAEGLREATPTETEWSLYLAWLESNGGGLETPRERLAAYFSN